MDPIARNSLKKALDLVRAGKHDQARPILIELLKDHPNVEQAWFLLSYTLPEGNRQIYALQQALMINPDYQRARQRLADLQESSISEDEGFARAFEEEPEAPASTPAFAFDREDFEPESDEFVEPFEEEPRPRRPILRILLSIVVFVVLITVGYSLAGDWLGQQLSGISFSSAPVPTATEVAGFRSLPPTWTPTAAQATDGPTATQFPSSTPTPQAFNFVPPDAQTASQIQVIEQEVQALRGLPAAEVFPAIIAQPQAVDLLNEVLQAGPDGSNLAQQEAVLAALGLIPNGYSMADYAISRQADQAGGFYSPDYQGVFIIGSDFSSLAPFYYAQAYDRAVINARFGLEDALREAGCPVLSDACRAALALLKGDASYLGARWLEAFGDPETVEAAQDQEAGQMLAQGQDAPPFVLLDIAFPYEQGEAFTQAMIDLGGWVQLDQVYEQPPTTTEQILHVEKYLAAEGAAEMEGVDLAPALAPEWQPLLEGSLGEWLSYLLLSQGAIEAARLPNELSSAAAAGWGGDLLQAYSREDGAVLLVVNHTWDSEEDAAEWLAAMQEHLDARYAVTGSAFEGGQCWQSGAGASCLWLAGDQTLWMLGPDTEVLAGVFALYTAFQ